MTATTAELIDKAKEAEGASSFAIYKYPIALQADATEVAMPRGAEVVSVAVQNGTSIVVYAIVNTAESRTEDVYFTVRGTGQILVGSEGEFIGTVNIGPFYWHVFYR